MKRRLAAAALALAASVAPVEAHKPTKTRFTFHKDVRPIFERRCGSCHREGGAAPMSLLGYRETFPWAVAIKNHVLALSMPPWFADERTGAFRHQASLSASEVDTIVDWCLGGTPEGDPAEAPFRSAEVEAPASEPDLLLGLPEVVLDAARGEATHEARLATGLPRERFVSAFEFRPGRPDVIRSARVYLLASGSKPGPPLWSWIAGESVEPWPEGRAFRLPARAELLVRVHFKKTWLDEGKEIRDRTSLGLHFSKGKPKPIESLIVAPGDGVVPLATGVEVLSVLPNLEARLDSLAAEAVLADGTVLPLIRLREPDPAWPRTYRFENPISLPRGSRVRVTVSSPSGAHALVLQVVGK